MEIEITGSALVAAAIVAHAWQSRIVGSPKLLNIIGWVLNVLVVLLLGAVLIRG